MTVRHLICFVVLSLVPMAAAARSATADLFQDLAFVRCVDAMITAGTPDADGLVERPLTDGDLEAAQQIWSVDDAGLELMRLESGDGSGGCLVGIRNGTLAADPELTGNLIKAFVAWGETPEIKQRFGLTNTCAPDGFALFRAYASGRPIREDRYLGVLFVIGAEQNFAFLSVNESAAPIAVQDVSC